MHRLAAVVLAISACGLHTPTPMPTASDAPAWMTAMASDPEVFTSVLNDATRAGWIALHAHDHDTAYRVLFEVDPVLATRAAWSASREQASLARFTHTVVRQLLVEWSARKDMPDTSGAKVLHAVDAWCHGDATTHQDAAAMLGDTPVERAVQAWLTGEPPPPGGHAEARLAARHALHQRARAGDVEPLLEVADEPLLVEQAEGFERLWFDPCIAASVAAGWRVRAFHHDTGRTLNALVDAPPSHHLLAPWGSAADLAAARTVSSDHDVLLSYLPSLDAGGLPPISAPDTTPEQARQAGRRLSDRIDTWQEAWAGQPGAALLAELDIAQRQRAMWVTLRADVLLSSGRPDLALAILEPAVDVAHPEVGARNPPMLYGLLAEARLRSGRGRLALDALRPLVDHSASVTPLAELASDLVVLRGIERQGDSKEN